MEIIEIKFPLDAVDGLHGYFSGNNPGILRWHNRNSNDAHGCGRWAEYAAAHGAGKIPREALKTASGTERLEGGVESTQSIRRVTESIGRNNLSGWLGRAMKPNCR